MDPYAWTWNPESLLLVPLLAVAYFVALRRFPAPRSRVASFLGAMALLVAVGVTPIHTLGMHYLLSVHLLQNVVLAEWAPALCVIGLPAAIRGPRLLTHPVVALPLWAGTYFVWHIPAVYDAALRHQGSLLHLEHLSYFVTGCLFWWPALRNEPHRLTAGVRAMYLFAAFVVASPLGLMLALIPRAIYDYYVQAPRLWGLSPLTDQQIGGGAMALEQAAVLFAVGTWYFLRFLSSEARADTFRTLGTPPSVQSPREMSDGR